MGRVYRLAEEVKNAEIGDIKGNKSFAATVKLVKEYSKSIENRDFHVCIARLMELTNLISKEKELQVKRFMIE